MNPRSESRRVVRTGDLSLVCHVRGRGPRCVAHPAGPGMHWSYLRMPLAERDHTMIYVEPAGTGDSSALPRGVRYDLATYVRHLDAVVRAFDDEPVFVLGHGHGGFIAQSYALTDPDGLAGLVLYSTGPAADAQMLAQARWNLHRDTLDNPTGAAEHGANGDYSGDTGAANSGTGTSAADTGEYDVDAATRRLREILPSHFAHWEHRRIEFAPMVAQVRCWPRPAADFAAFDLRRELSSITVPTLILAGAHDFVFGPPAAATLRAAMPEASVAIFENSGRFAHVEETERFVHVLAEFTSGSRQRQLHGPAGGDGLAW
ncbi:alpha/beta fold hydrolase [Actinoplanes derwentensis]|nr:alpha/beta hydrolase [Actinoplanes derwentensis]